VTATELLDMLAVGPEVHSQTTSTELRLTCQWVTSLAADGELFARSPRVAVCALTALSLLARPLQPFARLLGRLRCPVAFVSS
jgi:hypothetical protein